MPKATVRESGQNVDSAAPRDQASTIGAHPLACTATRRGSGRAGSIQPSARYSSKALCNPISPTPPPVGYRITSGNVQSDCSASSSPIVFLPSMR